MQFAPDPIPNAGFDNTEDPEYARLCPEAKAYIEKAIEEGTVDPEKYFEISVRKTETELEVNAVNVPQDIQDMTGSRGSVNEINALLGVYLPAMYTREDALSIAEDPIWAKHLDDNWGF